MRLKSIFLEQATAHSYFAFDDIPIIHTYVFVLIGLSKTKIIKSYKFQNHLLTSKSGLNPCEIYLIHKKYEAAIIVSIHPANWTLSHRKNLCTESSQSFQQKSYILLYVLSTWLSSPPRRSSRQGLARTGRPCCTWSLVSCPTRLSSSWGWRPLI